VCSISATHRRGPRGGRQDGLGAARGRTPIPIRQLVACRRTDPRSRAELKGDVPDQRLVFLVPRAGIVLPCPPLGLHGPCPNTDIVSSVLTFLCSAYCTLSGSSVGTTSEYPVCKATGKISRRELARCAATVSEVKVGRECQLENGNIRDLALQSFACQQACRTCQCGGADEMERTFNIAIKFLSVNKSSLAVRCKVLSWSSFFLRTEKSL
jgi:hypothetical protein